MLPAIPRSRSSVASHQAKKLQTARRSPSTAQSVSKTHADLGNQRRIPLPTQTICRELLKEGHVRSYIDFFRMVELNASEFNPPAEALHELKQLLTVGEDSQRSGDHRLIYESRKNIAGYFRSLGKFDIAMTYYKEALDRARLISNDRNVEIEATRNIGDVLESDGLALEASDMYEQSRMLARDQNNTEAEILAAKHLVDVRMKIARQQEKNGVYSDAIAHYMHCIRILQESNPDEETLNDLNYRLGSAFRRNGDIPTAIEYLETFLEKVRKYGDNVKEALAQEVLASCYESTGDLSLATQYLQNFLTLSSAEPAQRSAQARACHHLGILFNRMGDYDVAVQYFERHYEIACGIAGNEATEEGRGVAVDAGMRKIESSKEERSEADATPAVESPKPVEQEMAKPLNVGVAQVQLGISRANAHMDQFLRVVKDERKVGILLQWKATHSFDLFAQSEDRSTPDGQT
ncbi:hypothetical protein SpCBS45565_g03532 [Spizellomyces sp. 'palustris']|nr:hypothetical protein SpCBS45565_g03532 [Spizellomyces sp. 'palustris']